MNPDCLSVTQVDSHSSELSDVLKSDAYINCLSDWVVQASWFLPAFIVLAYLKPMLRPIIFPPSFTGSSDLWFPFQAC